MATDQLTIAAERLQIRLLGGLQLFQHDDPLKLKAPAKAASLLAYLILHRTRAIPREFLAFTLWPDDEEVKARANLRRHLLLLQQSLPRDAPWIIGDKKHVQWNLKSECYIDVAEFERLSMEPDHALHASALYKGDLLPDLYDDWILPERERLRRLQTANLERLTDEHRRNRNFTEAISAAQALLRHDPWREDVVRTLMLLRYESGDRAGALLEYDTYSKRLRAEMDVEPMLETRVRHESIVRNTLEFATQGVAAETERAALPNLVPFVGRAEELAQLRGWWERAVHGRGRVILMGGEAGIGKTRLAGELSALVEAQGGRTIGGITTFPETIPYQAVVEALRAALPMITALEIKAVWLSAACAVLPELRNVHPDLPQLPSLEPERQQARLFEALAHCLEGVARARPLLIVLEDLHWAGSATVSFLEYFTRRIRQHPICVVATYRDEEAKAAHPLREMRRMFHGRDDFANFTLGRLSKQDTERFVAAIPELHTRPPEFAERAHQISDGNPFFLGEIVQESIESSLPEPSVPRKMEAVIQTRIGRLSKPAQTIAGIAAVAGHAFDMEMLAAAAGIGEDEALRALDEMLDLRLVRHAHGAGTSATAYDFAFSHDLIAAQIYAGIPLGARKHRHHRLGVVMESLYSASIDTIVRELARHFDEGDDAERAALYYAASARKALAVYADSEALACLSRALELKAGESFEYELLSLREAIYGRQGLRVQQLADLERIEELAAQGTEPNKVAEALQKRITYARAIDDAGAQRDSIALLKQWATRNENAYWGAVAAESSAALNILIGTYEEGLRYADLALAEYAQLHDVPGRIRSLCLIAEVCTLQARTAQAQTAITEALELAQVSSGQALVARTLSAAALARFLAADYPHATGFAQHALQICRAIGDREGQAASLQRLAMIESRHFAIEEARQKYSEARAIYEALDKRDGQAAVLFNTGLLYLRIGQYREALQKFGEARAIFSALGNLRGLSVCAINVGMTAYLQGRYAASSRVSRQALRLSRRLHSPHLECVALSNLGAAERELGELPNAVKHSEEALQMGRSIAPLDLGSDLGDMGMTYLRAGNLSAAVAMAEEIRALDDAALQSVMFPQNVLWIGAQIYAEAAFHDHRAEMFGRAVRLLEQRLAAIPEGRWRESYRAMPFNREIAAALENTPASL